MHPPAIFIPAQLKATNTESYAMQLVTETVFVQQVPVIRCSGRLVFGEDTPTLCTLVENALLERRACVLNLSGVTHIDGHGIGILMQLWRMARNLDASLKLADVSPPVSEPLRATGVQSLLATFDSEEAAVGACYKHVA